MIKGMTGFGNTLITVGKVKGFVEIKSQNHRYFDLNCYLPIGFSSIENKIRQYVNKDIKRGRISVSIKILEKPPQKLILNKDLVKEYVKYARNLKREYGLDNDLGLSDVMRLPGIFEVKEVLYRVDALWPAIEKSLKMSLKSLVAMRTREGKSLAADTAGILKRMSIQIKKVEVRAKVILREKKKSLSVEESFASSKGLDVNEEIARLKHYVDEFKMLLKASVPVGKKLDFIAQEMQRETNTIGAKLQDKIVSNAVIAIKSKIEKLREQAQNIE